VGAVPGSDLSVSFVIQVCLLKNEILNQITEKKKSFESNAPILKKYTILKTNAPFVST
jgi:hypothetical protein